jgi:hypothetical protein
MKKIILITGFCTFFTMAHAQNGTKPTVDKPVKEIPDNADAGTNVTKQLLTRYEWRGARIWYPPNLATVDSVLSVIFNANGTVSWNKQGWEYVHRLAGTYRVSIFFSYPPYRHQLDGSYNANTGKITGTFTETKAVTPNAPPAYTPGTIHGEFNFYAK